MVHIMVDDDNVDILTGAGVVVSGPDFHVVDVRYGVHVRNFVDHVSSGEIREVPDGDQIRATHQLDGFGGDI